MVALRDARSWTGADLAAVLGEKTDWVRGREQGGTRVTEPEAERIAAALGTTTAGLIAAGQRKKAS
jgi:transcriptional regulator with XRE-family HTH domain